jgi:hypothetical protein
MVTSLLLAVIIAGIVAILKIMASVRRMNGLQTVKLDHIEILVDGRYSEVLQQLADVRELLAQATGTQGDRDRATTSQTHADQQEQRVKEAGPKPGGAK